MKIISITCQKGGVGKTTTTVQLAMALTRRRRRVLVIDLDLQANATDLLYGTSEPLYSGVREVLGEGMPIDRAALPTPSGVWVCGASESLEGMDIELAGRKAYEFTLQHALRAAPVALWDYVLIDCPPSLGVMSVQALVAADLVLTPVTPGLLPVSSLQVLHKSIARAVVLNPGLRPFGYLATMVNRRETIAQEMRQLLRGNPHGPPLWKTEILVDSMLKRNPAATQRTRGVVAYDQAALELMRRDKQMDRDRSARQMEAA